MPLSHPKIVDGWFHERSPQWPGQAFTLEVEEILHVEQSKYQDVLVFRSKNHGRCLVLDGAIQCLENDEFSYQEMIAHLPLASHPNPKRVLVIGGGDGGVLREVLKHPSIEKAVLCDIDEAVPRVSKEYLPDMYAGFNDPRVTLHIGDGFEFLKREETRGSYDVIITDSSDPEGPAKALFEKPYFQLLRDALAPGGTISTQGECMWIHLPLIAGILESTRTLFPKVEYAYTTIPSYPSGQIGFVIASLDEKRDLRTPLRSIPNCRYWSRDIHRSAFVLPEFARKAIQPSLSSSSGANSRGAPKRTLLLGSGFVAAPAADYILRRAENELTIACRTLETAESLSKQLARPAKAISLDVSDEKALDAAVAEHDLVISLIPYTFHAQVIKSAIRNRKHVVTTSYVSDAMRALDADAKKAGIVVLNEVGLDPGIDHLYAVKTIDDVHKAGGKITGFLSYCGGLPAPESADNPLGYKFSWSARGVLLALGNSAKLYRDGKLEEIDGKQLMAHAKPYHISPAFAFVAYPNRDSTPFREFYDIPEAKDLVRGTLRYGGFPEFIKALVDIGFLNAEPKEYLKPGSKGLAWNEVTAKAIGVTDASEGSLRARIQELTKFPSASEEQRIMAGLSWIGLFDPKATVTPRGNLLDTLCATLEAKMQYEQGERDMVMLQHKFFVENADGSKSIRTSTLLDFGEPIGSGGYSSMAKLVGVPCGISTQLILDGKITTPGVLAPYSRSIVDQIIAPLEAEGISMVEAEVIS